MESRTEQAAIFDDEIQDIRKRMLRFRSTTGKSRNPEKETSSTIG